MLDSQVEFALIGPHPPAEIPCCGQIRIEYKCPVNKGCAVIKVTNEPRERMSTSGQGDRVILAQLQPA